MINKKNISLVIALSIPLIMIVLVACFIYLPGLGKKPKHNFLYMTGSNYYSGYGLQEYVVSGNHLIKNPEPVSNNPVYPKPDSVLPHFYLYDLSANTANEITFERAQTYTLDSSNTSEDGYIIQRGNYSGGDLLFGGGGGDYNSWFIKGHNRSNKLNLKVTGADYYSFQFLGWVNN